MSRQPRTDASHIFRGEKKPLHRNVFSTRRPLSNAAQYDHPLHSHPQPSLYNDAADTLWSPDPIWLRHRFASFSAYKLLSKNESKIIPYIALMGIVLCALAPMLTLSALNITLSIYFITVIGFRLYLAAIAPKAAPKASQIAAQNGKPATPAKTKRSDEHLPIITILLPLYDEAASLKGLTAAIDQLDYPKQKIDVKLLLEEDDAATINAAKALCLWDKYDVITLPPSQPRTKPKACNYGLARAKGSLIVIYDAEDMPETHQLRQAAEIFDAGDETLACVQARLNYYNAQENWLTRLFSLEYALWFDSLLPALEKIGAPIPLGGTSNFFRTEILRNIGGWDPYNVTEDADLGMRLARYGYRTTMAQATTYEEANSQVKNWLRQRSRWMKGFIQTWIVHMRHPGQFYRAAGWRGFLSTQIFLAGTVFSAALNLILWAIAALSLFMPDFANALFAPALLTLNIATFVIGNLIFMGLLALAPLKRGWRGLSPYALLAPVYWILSSFAACMALWQLVYKPHYWEKTDHILSDEAAIARARTLLSLSAALK